MVKKNLSLTVHLGILFLVFAIVVFANFPFNSWFTGWDNLHPEFNFTLNFKRSLFASWQTFQGAGTEGGHGYAATLPHTLILFVLSFFLPDQYLRAFFTFAMLITGSVGVFFLLSKLLEEKPDNLKHTASLLSASFYLLNFATVQNFYVQLEAFIVHFAALPWLFYTLIFFLEKKTKKYALLFFAISFFASIQGFIPPLFVVYATLLGIFLVFYLANRVSFLRLKLIFIAVLITLAANAYWLFPVMHYSLTNTGDYLNSYNNLSSTEDFILKNKKYGNISNVILLRGFLSEAIDFDDTRSVFTIFKDWNNYLEKPAVQAISYVFFVVILTGAVYLFFKKEPFYSKVILVSFIILFSFIATQTPPFSFLSDLLYDFSITKQAFRVSFTKFSIAAAFFYSLLFGLGFYALAKFIQHLFKTPPYIFASLLFVGLIFFSLPIFTGHLLYERTKIDIPNAYFELFDFFKTQQKDKRIANLPQGWTWGWSIYNWGYSGSGFLWYGVEQPIMDRAFDVWGKANENYYWELSYALSLENFYLIDKIFDKYNIDFLIFDPNMMPYVNPQNSLYAKKFQDYIGKSSKYKLVKQFSSFKKEIYPISVYKVNRPETKPILSLNNIGPTYNFISYDRAFLENGAYYTDKNKPFDIYYPFRTLTSPPRSVFEAEFKIKSLESDVLLEKNISDGPSSFALMLPPIDFGQNANDFDIDIKKSTLFISIPKNQETLYDSKSDTFFFNHKAVNCNTVSVYDKIAKYFRQEFIQNDFIRFTSHNSENCYSIILDDLYQGSSYLVEVESRHIKGKPLKFALIQKESKTPNIEIPLSVNNSFAKNYVLSLPKNYYGLGYSLHFNNVSIGKEEAINDLKSVSLYSMPVDFLTGVKLENTDKDLAKVFIFYQSYHPSWKAYSLTSPIPLISQIFPFLFGKELKEHVLVNNWANGWLIPNYTLNANSYTLIIVFLPQYLQYLGFVLLIGTFVILLPTSYPHFFSRKK